MICLERTIIYVICLKEFFCVARFVGHDKGLRGVACEIICAEVVSEQLVCFGFDQRQRDDGLTYAIDVRVVSA